MTSRYKLRNINTQRCEAGQAVSRLDTQLARLRNATDYLGCLLIVKASDNDWKSDKTPEEYTGFVGVTTRLQIVQSEHKLLHINHEVLSAED